MQTHQKIVIASSSGLIVSFFLPWIQALGEGTSAYKISSLGGSSVALWIIPLSGVAAILVSWFSASDRQKYGLTFLCSFVALGGIIWALSVAGKLAGGHAFDILAIGFYLTLASALLLMAALLVGPYETEGTSSRQDPEGTPQPQCSIQALAELTSIHKAGLITDDEFSAKKTDIIAGIGRA